MIVGHLPAAYLVYKAVAPRCLMPLAFAAGMAGAVFPDIDMLWFYLVDNRQHHHHEYLTHRPMVWLGLLALCFAIVRVMRLPQGVVLVSFCAGGLIHMVCDSYTGSILWFWPFSDWSYALVTVQPTHSHWLLSFLAHWTFKVEIALCMVAAMVWYRSRR